MSQRKTPGQTPTIPGRTPKPQRTPPKGGPIVINKSPDKRAPAPKPPTPKRPAPKGGPVVNKMPDRRPSPQTKTTGVAAANNALNKSASKIKSARATSLGASTSKRTPLAQAATAVKARSRGR